MFPSI